MPPQSTSSEDFAFEILRVLCDQSLTSDSYLILTDVIDLAVQQGEIQIQDKVKTEAVNYLYANRFVDTWEDAANHRCIKINQAGLSAVQNKASEREAAENAPREITWLVPLILVILVAGGIAFALWKFKVFRR